MSKLEQGHDWVKVVDGGFPIAGESVDIAYIESEVPLVSVGYFSERKEWWYDHLRQQYLNKNQVTHWRHRPKASGGMMDQKFVSGTWYPIESAPKDGKCVDLYAEGRRFTDCYWSAFDKDWWYGFYEFDGRFISNPSHWMPRPPPPPHEVGE